MSTGKVAKKRCPMDIMIVKQQQPPAQRQRAHSYADNDDSDYNDEREQSPLWSQSTTKPRANRRSSVRKNDPDWFDDGTQSPPAKRRALSHSTHYESDYSNNSEDKIRPVPEKPTRGRPPGKPKKLDDKERLHRNMIYERRRRNNEGDMWAELKSALNLPETTKLNTLIAAYKMICSYNESGSVEELRSQNSKIEQQIAELSLTLQLNSESPRSVSRGKCISMSARSYELVDPYSSEEDEL